MGYDRVRLFEGVGGESTLISADKASSQTVYGYKFGHFASLIGFTVRRVVDIQALVSDEGLQSLVNNGRAQVAEFPEAARQKWHAEKSRAEDAIELKPPLDEHTLPIILAYLKTHCDPNDAGMIIDNRTEPEMCIADLA
ncbi:MAG: hypothetical protein JWM81_1031 [Candidatus Saccharibacteria bacterium]|nr:hypothetical protein [Candidatus Saccharibacteria bacterium]